MLNVAFVKLVKLNVPFQFYLKSNKNNLNSELWKVFCRSQYIVIMLVIDLRVRTQKTRSVPPMPLNC